jgi:hypothetical protein
LIVLSLRKGAAIGSSLLLASKAFFATNWGEK